jgi:hypothetical protein
LDCAYSDVAGARLAQGRSPCSVGRARLLECRSRKQAITAFVAAVTKQGAPDFVSPAERIATFDKELAPKHPDWKNKQPFKAVLERDLKALSAQGEKGAVQLVAATHTGMSTDEFNCIATDWIASGREIIERG